MAEPVPSQQEKNAAVIASARIALLAATAHLTLETEPAFQFRLEPSHPLEPEPAPAEESLR